MGIFEKTKGKMAKALLVLSAVVCCVNRTSNELGD